MPRLPAWLVILSAVVAVAAGAVIIVSLLRRPLVETAAGPAEGQVAAPAAPSLEPLPAAPTPAPAPAIPVVAPAAPDPVPAPPPDPPDDLPGWEAALAEAQANADEAALGQLIAGAPAAIPADRVAALELGHIATLLAPLPSDAADAALVSERLRTWPVPEVPGQQRPDLRALPGVPETVLFLDPREGLRCSLAGAPWRSLPALPERAPGMSLVLSPAQPGWILIAMPAESAHAGLRSEDEGASWRRLPWPAGLSAAQRAAHRLHLLGGGLILLDCPDGQGGREAWRWAGDAWSRLGAAVAIEPLAMRGGGAVLALGRSARGRDPLVGIAAADDAELRALGWDESLVRWPSADEADLVLGDDALLRTYRGRLFRIDRRLQRVGEMEVRALTRTGEILSLAADPARPERLWAVTMQGGLWRSDDGGANWRRGRGALASLAGVQVLVVPGRDLLLAGATWRFQDDEAGTCFGAARAQPVRSPALLTALAAAQRRAQRGAWPAEPATGPALRLLFDEFAQLEPLALPRGDFATRLVAAVREPAAPSLGDRLGQARLLRRMAGDGLEYEGGSDPDEPFRAAGIDRAWFSSRLAELPAVADAQAHPEFLVAYLDACAWIARVQGEPSLPRAVAALQQAHRIAAWLQARWGGERRVRLALAALETATAVAVASGSVPRREAYAVAFGERREAPRHLDAITELVAAQPGDASARRRLAEAIGDLDGWQRGVGARIPPGFAASYRRAAEALAAGSPRPAERVSIAIAAWHAQRHAPAAWDDATTVAVASLVKEPDPAVRYSRRGYLQGLAAKQAYDDIAKRWRAARPVDQAGWQARIAAARAVLAALEAGCDGVHFPDDIDARAACANHLAWDLLTADVRAVQDPAAALVLAHQAVQRMRLAGFLDTLALAQARSGDRSGAVATQQEAIAALSPRASSAFRAGFAERLEIYRGLAAAPDQPLPPELFTDPHPPAPARPRPAAPAAAPQPGSGGAF